MRNRPSNGISAKAWFYAQSFHGRAVDIRAARPIDCAGCSEPIEGAAYDPGCTYACRATVHDHALFCSQACCERDSEQRDQQASRAFHGA